MKSIKKFIGGAAAAAVASVSFAAPADAQYYRHRDRGIDTGDIIAGVAVIGGIAAIASALDRDGYRYGYGNRYRYRSGYQNAVNACAYEAERYGRGRIQITDVDRTGGDRYRVRGVITGGYDIYDRGYDRRRDYDYGYRDFDRYDRDSFTCTAYGNGRIANFRLSDRGNRYGW